jgi:hypothetical protein
MQTIFGYFQDYYNQTNKSFLLFCTAFAALLIFANFKWGIEQKWIAALPNRPAKFAAFYLLYLIAFGAPYLYYGIFVKPAAFGFIPVALLLLAPAIFALKVSAGGWQELIKYWLPTKNAQYFSIIADWPIRLLITGSIVILISWVIKEPGDSFAVQLGINSKNFSWWPYLLLLLAAIPLVAFAASQPAFLQTYPKLGVLRFMPQGTNTFLKKIGYELAYGSDFFTIELFFRGFLVVLLTRYFGTATILPMAVFYCSIHFGKPLLECISSYFGGLLLGIIACYSQSILGGIIVHLGLAWMMEFAALLAANRFLKA